MSLEEQSTRIGMQRRRDFPRSRYVEFPDFHVTVPVVRTSLGRVFDGATRIRGRDTTGCGAQPFSKIGYALAPSLIHCSAETDRSHTGGRGRLGRHMVEVVGSRPINSSKSPQHRKVVAFAVSADQIGLPGPTAVGMLRTASLWSSTWIQSRAWPRCRTTSPPPGEDIGDRRGMNFSTC